MIRVPLTPEDRQRAGRMAHERSDPKAAAGYGNRRMDANQKDVVIHYLGALGEIAVGKAFGTEVQHWTEARPDDGADTVIEGVSVDVKTRRGWNRGLMFPIPVRFRAEAAMLVCIPPSKLGHEREAIIRGWVTRERFMAEHREDDFGHGPTAYLPPDALSPVEPSARMARFS